MSNAVKGAPSGDHQNYIVTFDGPDAAEKAAQAQAMLGLQGIAPNVLSAPKNGRLVVQITPDQVDALEKSGARCYVDQEVTIPAPERLLNRSSPQLKVRDALSGEGRFSVDTHGADKLHAQGYKGSRVDLCVVDTGIDGTHPDIPTIEQGNFDDVFTPAPFDPPTDGNSHGTHCTGSAAGTQTVSGGKLGMAPEVRLFGAKVLDDSGSGSFSSIMKGVEFAIEKAKNSDRPMVVSMSLGGTARNPAADDPLVQMIEKATKEHGVLFVIAAGNSGPRANTINTPGIAPSAITVAAFDTRNTVSLDDDRVARFSSRGGTRRPSMDNKPDIGANGVNEF
ncbi:MAG: S8 family serine peptidase, partial [Myxococcota bacterium]